MPRYTYGYTLLSEDEEFNDASTYLPKPDSDNDSRDTDRQKEDKRKAHDERFNKKLNCINNGNGFSFAVQSPLAALVALNEASEKTLSAIDPDYTEAFRDITVAMVQLVIYHHSYNPHLDSFRKTFFGLTEAEREAVITQHKKFLEVIQHTTQIANCIYDDKSQSFDIHQEFSDISAALQTIFGTVEQNQKEAAEFKKISNYITVFFLAVLIEESGLHNCTFHPYDHNEICNYASLTPQFMSYNITS
ncbi:MAG TPA: hypothetical protein VNC84_06520 [Gammaproteobacteria bacterium]|jgi:hypothetical protein|nr:hypothetical protein [Gammaproteobacteria bacterium]